MISFDKILLINIFGIGDVLFTTPVIANLKKYNPSLFIGYLANRRAATVLKDNPGVDRIFIYERDEFEQAYRSSKLAWIKKWGQLCRDIKQERFDVVIDFSLNTMMSFLSWKIGIPQRVGFNYKNRGRFLTHKIPLEGYEGKHVVEHYLSLLDILGVEVTTRNLELKITPKDQDWARQFLSEQSLSRGKSVIGLVPGGGASWGKDARFKRWSAESYAKLADKIIEISSAAIILMGDEKELELCSHVAQLMKNKPFLVCGNTVSQFAALASQCSLVVVNDGGPLHMAVAAGAKTVSIFGPVDENVYGPFPKGQHKIVVKDLACHPCYRRFRKASCEHLSCLNQITVEDVLNKVKETLNPKH